MKAKKIINIPFSYLLAILTGFISSLMVWGITNKPIPALITVALTCIIFYLVNYFYSKANCIYLFNQCGILNIYRNQSEAEAMLQEKLVSVKSIDILTIRGLGIFGLKDSFMRSMLIDRAGQISIRVLFLDPDSKYALQRAREIKENQEAFINGIKMCQNFLAELKEKHNVNITASMYDALPIWRLFFFDNDVYISKFSPSCEGHHSEMYEINSDNSLSLHQSFKRYFDYLFSVSKPYI